MDKAQELRRGTSGVSVDKRRIKQPQPNFFSGLNNGAGGDFLSSDKSKREKLKRLSIIGIVNPKLEGSEMDSNLSDRDDETVGSSKNYKLPKKFFNDCDGVDQASVPRKLRSAMKKRYEGSLSPSPSPSPPDSKKAKSSIRGIESLKSEGVKKSRLSMKQRSLEEKPSGFVDSELITKDEEEVVETLYSLAGMFPTNDSKMESESLVVNLELKDSPVNDNSNSNIPAIYPEAANFQSNIEMLSKETVQVLSLNEPSVEEQSDICKAKEAICEIELQNSDSSPKIRDLKLHMQQPYTSFSKRKAEIIPVGSVLEEKKNTLWPGLSPLVLHDAGGSYQSQSNFNTPYRLDSTSCIDQSGGKVSRLRADGKSWKKSAAHIYISRLISNLQENKDKLPLPIPEQGSTMADKRAASEKYSTEPKNSRSNLEKLNRDHPPQKQKFDFLSLSTKVGGLEASKSYNGRGITLEPMTQLQVPPHIYSVGLQHKPPFSLLQAPHSHADFSHQLSLSSVPHQLKLPQYLGSQISRHPHPSLAVSTTGQQWLWAAELAARYRAPVETTTTSNSEVPCWVNGRNESPSLMPFYFSSYANASSSTISGNSFL